MSVSWVGILPYAWRPYYEECIATMAPEFKEHVMFVDNTRDNIGIMRAENLGIDKLYRERAEWLIVMSAAIRFGSGGLDFLKVIEDHQDCQIINGAGKWTRDGVEKIEALGFHLTAFHRSVFDLVGGFDSNLSNYSLDDVDLSIRILKGIPNLKRDSFPVDMNHVGTAHGINLAHIKGCAYAPRNAYMLRKWGRDGGAWQEEGYPTPFNDPSKPLSYCPEPYDPLSIHQVEFKSGAWNFED
jgi:hypothetical protein